MNRIVLIGNGFDIGSFPKDQQGLQQLSEVGKNYHWTKFESLKQQIIQQMRKECNIS